MSYPIDAVVAGHICLDLLPTFQDSAAGADWRGLRPGALYNVGPALRSTGGAVANTGLALHQLGMQVTLMGKVGDDLFGGEILNIIRARGAQLVRGMKISPGAASSYSVVINPPGIDRTFLHCPGCNDTFAAADLDEAVLNDARLFHFGYPPLMRSMYQDEGQELYRLLARVKRLGLTTSLDMAFPDPASPAGQVDWARLLARVLPQVDLFHPSIEELLFMLQRPLWDTLMLKGRIDVAADIQLDLLRRLSGRLIEMGAAIVMIKLADQGAYLRATSDPTRLKQIGRAGGAAILAWAAQEIAEPCFRTQVVGTTGSGDCTIAGLLAELLRGLSPRDALTLAVAVGACSVEQADATSGVPPLHQVQDRIAHGWPRLPSAIRLP